eukprot:s1359_g15.t1
MLRKKSDTGEPAPMPDEVLQFEKKSKNLKKEDESETSDGGDCGEATHKVATASAPPKVQSVPDPSADGAPPPPSKSKAAPTPERKEKEPKDDAVEGDGGAAVGTTKETEGKESEVSKNPVPSKKKKTKETEDGKESEGSRNPLLIKKKTKDTDAEASDPETLGVASNLNEAPLVEDMDHD